MSMKSSESRSSQFKVVANKRDSLLSQTGIRRVGLTGPKRRIDWPRRAMSGDPKRESFDYWLLSLLG